MKFYRVCHLTETSRFGGLLYHSGPYDSPSGPPAMAAAHSWDSTHPNLPQDFDDYELFGCGFTSLDQYEQWFEAEWRDEMHARGFVLRVFELDPEDIRVARYQSIARLYALAEGAETAEVVSLTTRELCSA